MTFNRTKAVAVAALCLLFAEGESLAQGFNAETWPAGTVETFPVKFDTAEYLSQAFTIPVVDFAPSRPFASGDLKMHRKIIANRFVTSLQANFDPAVGVFLSTNEFGSDTVELGWGANPFAPAGELADRRTGFSALPLVLEPAGFSMQERPVELIFQTDPARRSFISGRPTLGASRGYRIMSFDAGASATPGRFPPQTIEPSDRVTGLLRQGDDSITVRLADTRREESLAWWVDPPQGTTARNIVFAYARCNAQPTPRTFDRLYALLDKPVAADGSRGPAKNLIYLPECQGAWFITFRSISNTTGNRVFHFQYSTPRIRDNVNVGLAWATTAAERQTIRQALMRGAWMLYAMTGGQFHLRSFNIFNDANTCDDDQENVWNASCYGQHCDLCFDDSDGRSGYHHGGQLTMIKRPKMGEATVIAHELAHWLLGLDDEYRDADGCDLSVGICMHSAMAQTGDIKRRLCTQFDHLQQPMDQRPSSMTIAPEPGCGFACNGTRLCCDHPGGCDSASASARAFGTWKIPLLPPQDRSIEGTDYVTIFVPGAVEDASADWNNPNRGTLGRFNRLF